MANPYRNEYHSTKMAKGRAMGVDVSWGPGRAERITGLDSSKVTDMTPPRQDQPQMPEDKQGPGYANDASGWVRGAGERGEANPGFDPHKKSG